jgi:flavodoxin
MRAVVIYESIYGNTHVIADAVAGGLEPGNEVTVVPVTGATQELLDGTALLVAGGPTHLLGRPH